jgi:hypothetical protein
MVPSHPASSQGQHWWAMFHQTENHITLWKGKACEIQIQIVIRDDHNCIK